MSKTIVSTSQAPAAIGPYSQAVRVGALVFCSGQVGLDPATGELVPGGTETQTRRALENLSAVLGAAGATIDDVVKTTIYLTDLGDFGLVNGIYGEFMGKGLPARATVQVSALPKGASVEIEAIAHVGESR
jgi:2-iminobutanoate/2-iminopropanoate deaminase